MFHLDNTSGVPEMPEVKEPQSNTPRWFGESESQGGISWPGADWFNIVQAELLNALAEAGISPEKDNFRQLIAAIRTLGDADLRSNLGSGDEGLGAFLLAVKQPFIDAVVRTQNEKNAESISIMDFGGDRDGFDPSDYEAMAKSRANAGRRPYLGAQQFALPYQTLKVWKYIDGYRDRGAVASFSNISTPDANEPSTAVLGLTSAAGLGEYADRDAVGLFIRMVGQPALLVTSNTTFTANTLTSVDIASKIEHMRAGQIIDVTSASNSSVLYSGLIIDIDENTNTVTVDTAWYLKGGKGSTGIPPNGSTAAFVPYTKIWGENINVHLNETSYATRMAGFEMGLYNNKVGGNGYGYDAYSGGAYSVGQGFQTRGDFNIGFAAYSGTNYGFVAYSSSVHGFYSSSSSVGMMAQSGSYSFIAKNPSLYSFLQQTSSNGFVTGIDSNGAWQGLRYYHRTVSIGDKITQYTTVAYVTPSSASDVIYLPDIAYEKTITIRNLSKNYPVYLSGPYEYGAGGVTLPAMSAITLHCDSTYWYKIGGFSAS